MATNMNPDLMAGPDGARPYVPAPTPHQLSVKPYPIVKDVAGFSYYVNTVPNASMHRKDGMRLGFIFGFLKTELVHDKMYLEEEIESGNQYIRRATAEEIKAFEMKLDPRGTMKKELEPEIRAQIEAEVSARYEAEIAALRAQQEGNTGTVVDPKTALALKAEKPAQTDEEKLGGTESPAERLKKKLQASGAVRSGDAVVVPTGGGIGSTKDMATAPVSGT